VEFILTLHSINRWVIVAVGVLAAIKFLIGWLGKRPYGPLDRALMGGFAGLLDLQVLLGIILLIGLGLERYQIEHAITMVVAVVLAHLSIRWRNAADTTRFRAQFILIALALLIIYAGVVTLPQGWLGRS
jgi:hypothetical protein